MIQAETALATAEATLNEYINGTFVEAEKTIQNEMYDAESQTTTALQELKQAKAVFEHSKKLAAKAFVTQQTLEADEFAVQRAEIKVKQGKNAESLAAKKMEVLKDITYEKEKVQYESDIKAAKVKLASEREAYEVETAKLVEIQDMIEKCEIIVPPGRFRTSRFCQGIIPRRQRLGARRRNHGSRKPGSDSIAQSGQDGSQSTDQRAEHHPNRTQHAGHHQGRCAEQHDAQRRRDQSQPVRRIERLDEQQHSQIRRIRANH